MKNELFLLLYSGNKMADYVSLLFASLTARMRNKIFMSKVRVGGKWKRELLLKNAALGIIPNSESELLLKGLPK